MWAVVRFESLPRSIKHSPKPPFVADTQIYTHLCLFVGTYFIPGRQGVFDICGSK